MNAPFFENQTYANHCPSPFQNEAAEEISSSCLFQEVCDIILFVKRFVRNPTAVGSLIPSSPYLAKKMIKHISLPTNEKQQHILEVGAGTGAVTKQLMEKIKRGAVVDVVELDESFCRHLTKRFASYDNVHIHHIPIEQWKPPYKYDAIISGLPLNSFSPKEVKAFLKTFKALAKDQTTVHYFEYIGIAKIKKRFLAGSEKKNFEKVLAIKEKFFQSYGFDKDTVILNLPPARALHFKL
jgi:phosphatidylethanolamine/phosphatidyl-N-methylethanolamine N-methyltransferase